MSHPKDFVCPTCNAQLGERCKWDHGGKHRTWHRSREALMNEEAVPPALPGTVADVPESSPEESDDDHWAKMAKAWANWLGE